MKLRILFALATCISLLIITTLSYAEKRYVVDVIVVSLREGPAGSFRSLKNLKTGDSFTVLGEENNFIKVETKDGTIGWFPKKYSSLKPPKKIIVDQLSKKNDLISKENEKLKDKTKQLKEQLALKQKAINEVENKYSLVKKTENADLISLQKQLDTVTMQHNSLVEQSKSTIQTSKERDKLQKNNASLNKKIDVLEQQNTSLANKQALYWFLAGGSVFILGWLIGRVSCRRQKSSLTL